MLSLLRADYGNGQSATRLFISPETVKWHMRQLFAKIGVKGGTGSRPPSSLGAVCRDCGTIGPGDSLS
ncbi:MAG: hypothetical protein HY238_11045 [Acidobacteria bacterium]|nr:hypothetical protein [Acidobacteriota bacterium]